MRQGLLAVCLVLGGCAQIQETDHSPEKGSASKQWYQGELFSIKEDLRSNEKSSEEFLRAYFEEAISNNQMLLAQWQNLASLKSQVSVIAADKYPQLNFELSAARSGLEGDSDRSIIVSNNQVLFSFAWDVDLWGKLAEREQAALYDYLAAKSQFDYEVNQLVANVASAYWELVAQKMRLELASKRFANAQKSFEVVTSGYKLGFREPVDLYLAKNESSTREAAVVTERQRLLEATISLQVYLGRNPSGRIDDLPEPPQESNTLFALPPGTVIENRQDISAAWLKLLAADSQRAAAYKDRLPSLNLDTGIGYSSAAIANVLESGLWSIAGALAQPILDGGRIKAEYTKLDHTTRALQYRYNYQIQIAMQEVESELSRYRNLDRSLNTLLAAEESAVEALRHANDSYVRGLTSYTTVLEAQRRAFESSFVRIDARNQIHQTRIALYTAMGVQHYSLQ